MKTLLSLKQSILNFFLFTLLLSSGQLASAQELQFKNSILESGTSGQDNAVYRFPNVDATHDALVIIKGRSSTLTTLSSIDLTSTGFSKSFQPQVMYKDGSVNTASSWWMEFEIKFVDKGTSTSANMPTVFATGIDIDGDDNTLCEFNTFYGSNYYIIENSTQLSMSNVIGNISQAAATGKKFKGIAATHTGIDTIATKLMTTNVYINVNKITIRVGSSTTDNSDDTDRMHSIWFKGFSYSTPLSTLPVKLVSFTASLNNYRTDLKWTTATETNVSHFVVERSTDGVNFSVAGMVFAYGNTTTNSDYALSDNISNLQSGIIYYRLCSVDVDGKTQYSEVRIIKVSKQGENVITVITYPNPVTNELKITIPANWQNKKIMYEVFNSNGQVSKKSEAANSSQTETLNVSRLNSGLYIVKVTCEGQTAQQKIIKQ